MAARQWNLTNASRSTLNISHKVPEIQPQAELMTSRAEVAFGGHKCVKCLQGIAVTVLVM